MAVPKKRVSHSRTMMRRSINDRRTAVPVVQAVANPNVLITFVLPAVNTKISRFSKTKTNSLVSRILKALERQHQGFIFI